MPLCRFVPGIVVLALVLTSGGCATALRGSKDKVEFKTEPAEATVVVDGTSYPSPAKIKLTRKDPHGVVVWAPGYQAVQFTLEAQWDGASLGGFVLPGGSLMVATDAVNGADRSFYDLETIRLQRLPAEATTQPATQPVEPVQMKLFKGRLLTPEQYEAAREKERADTSRFFGDQQ